MVGLQADFYTSLDSEIVTGLEQAPTVAGDNLRLRRIDLEVTSSRSTPGGMEEEP